MLQKAFVFHFARKLVTFDLVCQSVAELKYLVVYVAFIVLFFLNIRTNFI